MKSGRRAGRELAGVGGCGVHAMRAVSGACTSTRLHRVCACSNCTCGSAHECVHTAGTSARTHTHTHGCVRMWPFVCGLHACIVALTQRARAHAHMPSCPCPPPYHLCDVDVLQQVEGLLLDQGVWAQVRCEPLGLNGGLEWPWGGRGSEW